MNESIHKYFRVSTLRPYITHFHIGNAVVKKGFDGYGDKHPRFGYSESANDTEELRDFFQVLKGEGFFNAAKPYVLSIVYLFSSFSALLAVFTIYRMTSTG